MTRRIRGDPNNPGGVTRRRQRREAVPTEPAEPVFLEEAERMIHQIIDSALLYHRWKRPVDLEKATLVTEMLNIRLQTQEGHLGKTTRIGLLTSIGQGYNVVDSGQGGVKAEGLPRSIADSIGYILLRNDTAEATARVLWHLQKMNETAEAGIVPPLLKNYLGQHEPLLNLLRRRRIPIPDSISGAPVIGPIGPLGGVYNHDISALFSTWIRGRTLHDMVPYLNELTQTSPEKGGLLEEKLFWIVFQSIGVWQSSHPPLPEMGSGLEEQIRVQYHHSMTESVIQSAGLLGVEVATADREGIEETVGSLARALEIDSQNIRPYFDAALRNYILAVGEGNKPAEDLYNKVMVGSQVNMKELLDLTQRVDFSHAKRRPYAIRLEDPWHIGINWQGERTDQEMERGIMCMLLTSEALDAYDTYYDPTKGHDLKYIQRAANIAEELEALENTRSLSGLRVQGRMVWQQYHDGHRTTFAAMPFMRTARQAYLALCYAAKALASRSEASETITGEAAAYFLSAANRAENLRINLEGTTGAQIKGIERVRDLLSALSEQAEAGKFNEEKMTRLGTKLLSQYQ